MNEYSTLLHVLPNPAQTSRLLNENAFTGRLVSNDIAGLNSG